MFSTEPLLIIPGLSCDGYIFRRQINALTGVIGIHVAELPPIASVGGMADEILSKAPPAFHLLGFSMGGYLCFEIFKKAARRVRSLTLMATTATRDTAQVASRRQAMQETVESGGYYEMWRKISPRFIASSRKDDSALIEEFMEQIYRTRPEDFLLHQKAMMDRPCYMSVLETIDVPTNILIGDDDFVLPAPVQEAMAAKIRGCRISYIQDCGHLPTLERPEQVSKILSNWFAADLRRAA